MVVNYQAWKSHEHNHVGGKNDTGLPACFLHELANTHSRLVIEDNRLHVGCGSLLRVTYVMIINDTRNVLLVKNKLAPYGTIHELVVNY